MCSAGYWSFFVLNFIVGIVAILLNEYFLNRTIRTKPDSVLLGVDYKRLDNVKARSKLIIIGFFAGTLAATLGLGGGVI